MQIDLVFHLFSLLTIHMLLNFRSIAPIIVTASCRQINRLQKEIAFRQIQGLFCLYQITTRMTCIFIFSVISIQILLFFAIIFFLFFLKSNVSIQDRLLIEAAFFAELYSSIRLKHDLTDYESVEEKLTAREVWYHNFTP